MTGQIPTYGDNFKHEHVAGYHPVLASRAYVLKIDNEWFIRSDKSSKRWYVFHGMNRDQAINMGKVQPSFGKAMHLLLDGIAGGFYYVRKPDSDGNWHCIHERQAAASGTWRTDQNWTSHCKGR